MIKHFRHKGVERFFFKGVVQGIHKAHAARVRLQLSRLDDALTPEDMNAPQWKLHPADSHWAVWVDYTWRITFDFEGQNAVLLDYRKHSPQES